MQRMPVVVLFALHSVDMQVARLQDQVTSLKASNENLQKQTEDLINKLKEVIKYE